MNQEIQEWLSIGSSSMRHEQFGRTQPLDRSMSGAYADSKRLGHRLESVLRMERQAKGDGNVHWTE